MPQHLLRNKSPRRNTLLGRLGARLPRVSPAVLGKHLPLQVWSHLDSDGLRAAVAKWCADSTVSSKSLAVAITGPHCASSSVAAPPVLSLTSGAAGGSSEAGHQTRMLESRRVQHIRAKNCVRHQQREFFFGQGFTWRWGVQGFVQRCPKE